MYAYIKDHTRTLMDNGNTEITQHAHLMGWDKPLCAELSVCPRVCVRACMRVCVCVHASSITSSITHK